MTRWTLINSIGGLVISACTLIAATYLLYSLLKQGQGKLRVRLLLGMVISDIILGLVALVQEALYLSGRMLQTGTRGCDAGGFLLTAVLFSQHLWTLAIALATFLLLKHPLSRWTYWMEKCSWFVPPFVWACSVIQSAIWHVTVGWRSGGALCSYGSASLHSGLEGNLLIQFIPRALVFFVIVILYSSLFSFLRRPDTIQLSSQFVSGGSALERTGGSLGKTLRQRLGGRAPKNHQPVDPDAPWEQLEFIQVGNTLQELSPVPTTQPAYQPNGQTNHGTLVHPRPLSIDSPNNDPSATPPVLDPMPSPPIELPLSEVTPSITLSSNDQSEKDIVLAPELQYEGEKAQGSRTLSPVNSERDVSKAGNDACSEMSDTTVHALRMFFQDNPAVGLEDGLGGCEGEGTSRGGVQMSAAAYFNRQASLLMLYFPLAYLVVFSMSLVRLIYGMAKRQPSPVLSLLSNWMVLSVGLIDGLVYGLAELIVRRKVRRKMPDRL